MIAPRFFGFLPVFLFLVLRISSEPGIWREILLENFETTPYSSENLKTKLEKGTSLPDISLSENFTAPIPNSKKALVIRIPKEANRPFSFYFSKPIVVNAFIREIQFPIYSSGSLGNWTLLVGTLDAELKQLPITSLNYKGWRNITVPMSRNLDQNDRVFNQQNSIRILGFYYLPFEENSPNQEVLIAIDDITAIVRDKYRPLKNKEILLED